MDNKMLNAAQEVSRRLNRLAAEYRVTASAAFVVLVHADFETAELAVSAHDGDQEAAALWFASHLGVLNGITPWELMATGDVVQVRRLLWAVNIGEPP
jgi:hypothetical protein